jgi:hypothetical protein
MELVELIKHPEQLDRNTVYELRSMIALHPTFQTARLLLLKNLYLMHDPSFDEELRRAAISVGDRSVLFSMTEAMHYRLQPHAPAAEETPADDTTDSKANRTITLIDSFLDTLPHDDQPQAGSTKRKPTPADATVDYVAYLLETEDAAQTAADDQPEMIGQNLIDTFINTDKGKIVLNEKPEYLPQIENSSENGENDNNEGVFTETLARIYIKQGRYSKALEIIKRLSLDYPKKNAYFADQIRFLEKLIINNNKK